MNNQHFYQPQIIFTRLKDVFNEERNPDTEDFSPQNYIKPMTIKKVLDQKENKNNSNKKSSKNNKNNLPEEKKKYVNKDLVESWIEAWIEAIKSSKLLLIYLFSIYRLKFD